MVQSKKSFFRILVCICLMFLIDEVHAAENTKVSFVTDLTFEQEVLHSSLPVVVSFGARWCGPCRMMDPILEKISLRYKDKVKIVKINVDENRQVLSQFPISVLPTLLLFKEGKILGKKVGLRPKTFIIAWLDQYL